MAIVIEVYINPGDKSGPEIKDKMIISEILATDRGQRFLDDPDQGGNLSVSAMTLSVPPTGILPVEVSDFGAFTVSKLNLADDEMKITGFRMTGIEAGAKLEIYTELYKELSYG